jgi:hypothetical protein
MHGLVAGILAALAAIVYNKIYAYLLVTDFSKILSNTAIASANILTTLLVSLAYFVFAKVVKKRTILWFNLIFTVATFASFLLPFFRQLPLEMNSPELYIGLVIPMHLFPQFFWLTSKPFIEYSVPILS